MCPAHVLLHTYIPVSNLLTQSYVFVRCNVPLANLHTSFPWGKVVKLFLIEIKVTFLFSTYLLSLIQ